MGEKESTADWLAFVEVITVGADDPVTADYDYDICIRNSHPTQSLTVTCKIILDFGERIETHTVAPQTVHHVETVSGGPVFNNCRSVELLSASVTS